MWEHKGCCTCFCWEMGLALKAKVARVWAHQTFLGLGRFLCCDWQVWPYRAAAKPSQPKNRLRLFAASPGFKSSRGGSSTWKIYVTEIFGVGLLLGRTMAQPRTSILATGCHPAMGPRQAGRQEGPSQSLLLLCAQCPSCPWARNSSQRRWGSQACQAHQGGAGRKGKWELNFSVQL